jgi:hypothetical protein
MSASSITHKRPFLLLLLFFEKRKKEKGKPLLRKAHQRTHARTTDSKMKRLTIVGDEPTVLFAHPPISSGRRG